MKIAKTRLRPAPRQLELDVHFAVSPVGLPNAEQFAHWVAAALRCGPRVAQIGLRVVDEAEGRSLNHDYRGKDSATNVLSFALNEGEETPANLPLFGDIVLCAPVVAAEAAEQHKTLAAHYAHLTVHGVLHLRGYDHANDAEAESMEALETAILARLGYANPYAEAAD